MLRPEEFHYQLLLQVISHICVNVADLSGFVDRTLFWGEVDM